MHWVQLNALKAFSYKPVMYILITKSSALFLIKASNKLEVPKNNPVEALIYLRIKACVVLVVLWIWNDYHLEALDSHLAAKFMEVEYFKECSFILCFKLDIYKCRVNE